MSQSQPFRVGIVGLSPQGRDLLERLSLQPRGELLLYETAATASDNPLPLKGVSRLADWHRFLFESQLNAVLFLDGLTLDPDQLRATLDTQIPTGVLVPLMGEPDRWQPFASISSEQLRLLSPHRESPDFRAALAWWQSGEVGPLTAIKHLSWVPDLIEPTPQPRTPDVWFAQGLWEDVDQLLCLTGKLPEMVFAAEFSKVEQRYFLVLRFAGGLVAHLERRRSSVVPLEWGWTLTGPVGGYAKQQRYVKTDAGEIYDVPAELPPLESDPLFAPLTTFSRTPGLDSSWNHAVNVLRVHEAVFQSAQTGEVARL